MGTAIKHPMPDRVNPSFVIVDILALRSRLHSILPIIKPVLDIILNKKAYLTQR